MCGASRDRSQTRFSGVVVIGLLIGFPLVQSVVGSAIVEWGSRSDGRGWVEFFLWIIVLEWTLFAVLWRDLKTHGYALKVVGFPAFTKNEVMILTLLALGIAAFVLAVGDSTSDRILNGPWYLPRLKEEKLLMLPVALTAGICEETIFRGYLFHGLRRGGLGAASAVVLVTASFVFIHGFNQSGIAIALRTVAAIILTALYFWRGSLKLPIVVHALLDAQLALSV